MPNIILGGVAGEAFNAIDNYLESRGVAGEAFNAIDNYLESRGWSQ